MKTIYWLTTVYRDIEHLKQVANEFIFSLAKENLAYFCKDLLDDINKARLNAWAIFHKCTESDKRNKLLALKTVIGSNESIFNLLQQGPTVMQVRVLEERLSKIENSR